MDKPIALSVVIPVYNEENNLDPLYSELSEELRRLVYPMRSSL